MSNTIRNALLLMCIFTFPSGCVSTPPPKEPTPVEQRETSVMTARETRVIEVNKELFTAAFHGRTSEAKAFFEAQEDEEVRMKDGWTALLLACGRGHTEVVLALVEAGVNVNGATACGGTALMDASMHGNTETVRVLLEAGAGVNERTEDGVTALMEASRLGHEEIVQLLRNAGALDEPGDWEVVL